ncbi:MAG: type II toxin-antitoxin system HicA family toxin [Deltaproteobacteria bacterium]|nr:type II toxin-antitoxin system HicA family toxin [Deltaproteobacteria bacterium]
MPYTYREFHQVLQQVGFKLVRSGKHETWIKEEDGFQVAMVRVSHQHGKDIPRPLFREMLRQAKLTEAGFVKLLVRR